MKTFITQRFTAKEHILLPIGEKYIAQQAEKNNTVHEKTWQKLPCRDKAKKRAKRVHVSGLTDAVGSIGTNTVYLIAFENFHHDPKHRTSEELWWLGIDWKPCESNWSLKYWARKMKQPKCSHCTVVIVVWQGDTHYTCESTSNLRDRSDAKRLDGLFRTKKRVKLWSECCSLGVLLLLPHLLASSPYTNDGAPSTCRGICQPAGNFSHVRRVISRTNTIHCLKDQLPQELCSVGTYLLMKCFKWQHWEERTIVEGDLMLLSWFEL